MQDLCNRMFMNYESSDSDCCQYIGQALLRPFSLVLGYKYKVEKESIEEIHLENTTRKVVFLFAAFLLLPLTLCAAGLGIALLSCSKTHARHYETTQYAILDEIIYSFSKDAFRIGE